MAAEANVPEKGIVVAFDEPRKATNGPKPIHEYIHGIPSLCCSSRIAYAGNLSPLVRLGTGILRPTSMELMDTQDPLKSSGLQLSCSLIGILGVHGVQLGSPSRARHARPIGGVGDLE